MLETIRERRWRRQRRALKAAAFVGLLCAAVYLRLSLFPALTGLLHRVGESRRTAGILHAVKTPPSRPIYPYSVIRGGAYSAAELRDALDGDPVAARHYIGFRRSMTHTIDSSFDAPVYLSYRIGNAVYWTSQPVRLPKGETLLTDGENYARARCGNRISEAPKTPVNDTEPAPETLNTPEVPNTVPELENWSEDRLLFPTTTAIAPSIVPTTVSAVFTPVNEIGTPPEWWLVSGPNGYLDVPIIGGIPRNLFPLPGPPVIQPVPIPGYTIPPTPTGFTPPTTPTPPGSPPVAVLIPPEIPPEIWPPTVPTTPTTPVGPIGPVQSVPEPALIAPLLLILGGFLVAQRHRRP